MTHAFNDISIFVREQFPSFFEEKGENLLRFIELYYEWMDSLSPGREIVDYRKIEETPDTFFEFLHNEFMHGLPKNIASDRHYIIKHIVDFYRTKGTEESFRILFRILYGEENIEFYYPGKDIFRSSNAKWKVDQYITVKFVDDQSISKLNSSILLKGKEKETYATFETFHTIGNTNYLYLDKILKSKGNTTPFLVNEVLINAETNEEVATIVNPSITVGSSRFLSADGFASSTQRLQDNRYYQEFSYEIISDTSINYWGPATRKYNHLAGTLPFGKIKLNLEIDVTNSLHHSISFGGQQFLMNALLGHVSDVDINYMLSHGVVYNYNDPQLTTGLIVDSYVTGYMNSVALIDIPSSELYPILIANSYDITTAELYTPVFMKTSKPVEISGIREGDYMEYTPYVNNYLRQTVRPKITGSGVNVGTLLTATPGTYTSTEGITVTRQWYRGSTAIGGQTGTTYTLVVPDIGYYISVKETAETSKSRLVSETNSIGIVTA